MCTIVLYYASVVLSDSIVVCGLPDTTHIVITLTFIFTKINDCG